MTHLNLDGYPVEELNASIDLLQVCTCLVRSLPLTASGSLPSSINS